MFEYLNHQQGQTDVVAVLLLAGSNDCLGNLSPGSRSLIKMYNPWIPVRTTLPTTTYLHTTAQGACPGSQEAGCCLIVGMFEPQAIPKLEAYRGTALSFLETVHRYFPRARIGWLTVGQWADGIGLYDM